MLLEGDPVCYLNFMLDQSSFAQIQVTAGKQVLPFEEQCSFSGSGHSLRPWRSRASKTHPFWGLLFDSSESLARRTTGGTWLGRHNLANHSLCGDFYGMGT